MTGIERLVDIVNDGPYSGGMIHISVQKLREICEQIEREVDDISGYESDVLAWVESKGGLEAVKKRLMPEGTEWPRFEDGEPVGFGDEFENARGGASVLRTVLIKDCRDSLGGDFYWKIGKGKNAVTLKNGERVKRPAPKVYDADGVEIREGDTVYFTDGRRQECNTVVHAKYDYKDEPYVQLGRLNDVGYPTYTNCSCIDPSQLTHTKPEPPDSCEQLDEDATIDPRAYFSEHRLYIDPYDGEERDR